MQSWLVAPLDDEVSSAISRLRRAPDVQRVAVVPDVHLAEHICAAWLSLRRVCCTLMPSAGTLAAACLPFHSRSKGRRSLNPVLRAKSSPNWVT